MKGLGRQNLPITQVQPQLIGWGTWLGQPGAQRLGQMTRQGSLPPLSDSEPTTVYRGYWYRIWRCVRKRHRLNFSADRFSVDFPDFLSV